MSRTLSLAALSTLLLATAVEAYPGGARDTDGYRAMDQPQGSVTACRLRPVAPTLHPCRAITAGSMAIRGSARRSAR